MLPGDGSGGSDDAFEDALDGFDEASPEESELGPPTPSVTVPDYENRFPEPGDEELAGSLSDLHPDTARTFIICVVLANAAILLVSLGAMFAYFRGMIQVGGGLVLLGLFAAVRTYMQYANWREGNEERDAAASDRGVTAEVTAEDGGPENGEVDGGATEGGKFSDETTDGETTDGETTDDVTADHGATGDARSPER